MAGRLTTEKGLGDGIKSFFEPLLDALNVDDNGKPITNEQEKYKFPETARRILNAFFSAKVRSSFKQKSCGDDKNMLLVDDSWMETLAEITEDKIAEECLPAVVSKINKERQAQLIKALELEEEPRGKGAPKEEQIIFAPPEEEEDGCFYHTGTSGFVSKGAQSNTTSFELAIPAGKIGLNLKYAAVVTIVGQEPEISSVTPPAGSGQQASEFAPPGEKFTGAVKGNKELTIGGLCSSGGCEDEWVTGTAKITILFGMKVRAGANVPEKLKSAVPALGGSAGFVSQVVYTFDFLHYPRVAPAGITDPEQ